MNCIKKSIFIGLLVFNQGNAQNVLSEPFASLTPLPYLMQSLFNKWGQNGLKHFIVTNKPKIIVEVGSWTGASAIFMAKLINDDPEAKLYCVDTFLGSVEHHEIENYRKFLPNLYLQFLSNCIHEKVSHKIIPVRMSSQEATIALSIRPDLVYIDASHDEENVYNDVMWWYKKKSPEGIICGDDYDFGPVKMGVDKAAQVLGVTIKNNASFWWFEE